MEIFQNFPGSRWHQCAVGSEQHSDAKFEVKGQGGGVTLQLRANAAWLHKDATISLSNARPLSLLDRETMISESVWTG